MMKTLVSLAALLTLTATASAEPYDATQPERPRDGLIIGNVSLGVDRVIQVGGNLEGARRIGDSQLLYAHGMLAVGKSGGQGSFQQLRAGIEARRCAAREWMCFFGGVDAGYQHDAAHDEYWTLVPTGNPGPDYVANAHDLMLVPRVGLELGKELKLRGAFERTLTVRVDDRMDSDESRTGGGFAFMLGAGYAW